ncbi:trehalose-phosphatase [Microbacterium imperiale]|uniref:Trehalose 6-phosphate phosphatase n=1 Tax=Microbacterium imperiale TaxID=33884 RepID=A0A9W6M2P0_9MICO|nr:trehalose-phosphatase [Microbacterium imperiale]MBP2419650.1 trehalose 6-phosphate phosphatase [Microbacterium imperiale]MDS0198484.1 trehalose-phosphatase [Microbacterium imperiale]BFE39991.1 trehalose-phosphatase [Microbacterium imperiale]GLJ79034.1 trehalose 6-phosphate phosphatase [Microbacterium imperiale]
MSDSSPSPSGELATALALGTDARHLLVALDFDGTLAPLVDEPMSARMLPEARDALTRLSSLPDTTVALVSGRTLAHLAEISEREPDSRIHLAGSHGAEFWHPGGADDADADDAGSLRDTLADRAEAIIADTAGAWIERKRFGFALHTRLSDPERAAEAAARIDDLVRAEAPEWRRRTGQDILEFASRHEGKDAAIRRLRELVDADVVLFAGDDVTDEDALASLGAGDIGIRVGGGESVAAYRVADAAELAALLSRLAEARAGR